MSFLKLPERAPHSRKGSQRRHALSSQTGRYDAFCLVTSDADFTRLATRLREDGATVIGIGKQYTPRSFVAACSQFVAVESLERAAIRADALEARRAFISGGTSQEAAERAAPTGPAGPAGPVSSAAVTLATKGKGPAAPQVSAVATPQQQQRMRATFAELCAEQAAADGWTMLSRIGDRLKNIDPAFDPRLYGTSRSSLSDLVDLMPEYELSRRDSSVWVRRRSIKAA